MIKYLNRANREPAYFISLYGNYETAREEANRRTRQRHIPGQSQLRLPETVRIYFSRERLLHMLQAPPKTPVFYNSAREEWFVLEFIPDSAVRRVLTRETNWRAIWDVVHTIYNATWQFLRPAFHTQPCRHVATSSYHPGGNSVPSLIHLKSLLRVISCSRPILDMWKSNS